ncbi:MAG: efflux RND transporter permease subunit, partial [Candidatus Nucleicultricaceae bacterium]
MNNFSLIFILMPIATNLFGIGISLACLVAFYFLPVSSLPQVEFPTITVRSALPGASPEIMASSIATPLEKQLSAIAGVTEMTSISSLGSTQIVMQLDLDKNVDDAARSAQAAINAAAGTLPHNLPNRPTYKKVNPIDGPIMVLAISSKLTRPGEIYDFASSILSQKLSQVDGVGEVIIGGGSLPAVRIQLNSRLLNHYGISFNDVRTVIGQQTGYLPKGQIANDHNSSEIVRDYHWFSAKRYLPLIIAYKNGQPVRLSDLGTAIDSVEDIYNAGMANGEPSNVLIFFKQPGANVIQTVKRLYEALDTIKGSIPSKMNLTVLMDRTTTIRASLDDVKKTMIIALILVVLVVYSFLRNIRATLIPSIAIPLSVFGTFGVMYLFGYSINNLSLMALTIAIGFVVDDAVVVLENIMRHMEQGLSPIEAAKKGAREVSFTVVSMSLSLIAVFIPILLMGGIIGRIFHEFAMTLSIAIIISLFISLSITPMMSARLIKHHQEDPKHLSFLGKLFQTLHDHYAKSLSWALKHTKLMLF